MHHSRAFPSAKAAVIFISHTPRKNIDPRNYYIINHLHHYPSFPVTAHL
jgi:hypothetical protein